MRWHRPAAAGEGATPQGASSSSRVGGGATGGVGSHSLGGSSSSCCSRVFRQIDSSLAGVEGGTYDAESSAAWFSLCRRAELDSFFCSEALAFPAPLMLRIANAEFRFLLRWGCKGQRPQTPGTEFDYLAAFKRTVRLYKAQNPPVVKTQQQEINYKRSAMAFVRTPLFFLHSPFVFHAKLLARAAAAARVPRSLGLADRVLLDSETEFSRRNSTSVAPAAGSVASSLASASPASALGGAVFAKTALEGGTALPGGEEGLDAPTSEKEGVAADWVVMVGLWLWW
ncbi:hypothetical protein cyc_08998 [Cyclospora cayetanensis]|uniref:Uncharacterized protein n=1 Tax=Cyclospora cayetanensis TaxID=88456 RepID=A0A1D3D1I8_9EIME|nr:hypothetical protein cyc_08998 [Cyclospora cayetanensis]